MKRPRLAISHNGVYDTPLRPKNVLLLMASSLQILQQVRSQVVEGAETKHGPVTICRSTRFHSFPEHVGYQRKEGDSA